jgi:glycosyltransferase involved in cell wall biosynthesis
MSELRTGTGRIEPRRNAAALPRPAAAGGKVAFLLRSLNYGGAERQLVALARGLHERGRRVVVLVFYGGGPLHRDLDTAGVPVRVIGKRGRWDVGGFLLRLHRVLREEKPDVLHGYLDVPNLLTVPLKVVHPGLRVVWGVRASNMDFDRYDTFTRATFGLTRRVARRADLIIANSRAGREHHVGLGYPGDRTVVVPNGIDVDRFRQQPEAGGAIRAAWAVSPDEVLVGLVGRLDPMKDHATFLRAARRVADAGAPVRFVCVGDGDGGYRAAHQRLAEQLGLEGRVLWSAGRNDMPAVYNALDLLCSASAYGEGFSNVIGEAMACGVPCVVTDVGDSAWIVGDTGRVVPPGSPERLGDAILQALEDRSELASRVRPRVVESFSVSRLVDSTERLLWPSG